MKLIPQTQVGEWEYIASTDPALAWPEQAKGETDDAFAARQAPFVEALERARETGDYGPVLREGAKPVVWRFHHLKPRQRTWLRDQTRSSQKGPREVSFDSVALALVAASDRKIRRAPSADLRGWTAVLDDDLEAIERNPALLIDLGIAVMASLRPQSG